MSAPRRALDIGGGGGPGRPLVGVMMMTVEPKVGDNSCVQRAPKPKKKMRVTATCRYIPVNLLLGGLETCGFTFGVSIFSKSDKVAYRCRARCDFSCVFICFEGDKFILQVTIKTNLLAELKHQAPN